MTLFAAMITSSLTVTLFHHQSPFDKPHDLYERKVAVEKGSKEANIVKGLGADYVLAENPLQELQGLDREQYDAVVAPYEILHQELRNHPELKVHLSSLILAHEAFAFVISSKANIHQQLNLTLTKLQDDGFTRHICQQHAIEFSHSCDF
jgi:ABC-type amino acid transport substrate-binding protein